MPGIAGPDQVSTILKRSASATLYRFWDLLALDDFERHAKRLLPPVIYLYVAAAVETGTAFWGARVAHRDYALVPRLLRDTSCRSQQVELFGKTFDSPFGIPPLGGAAFVGYQAKLVLAEAARQANIPMTLSASSLIALEDMHAQN